MNILSIKNTLSIILPVILTFATTKVLAQPTVQWDKTYGGNNYESMRSAFKTQDEGFLLVGQTESAANGADITQPARGYSDYFVVRIDSLGTKLWDKRYGGDTTDLCYKAIQNTEGYLLIGISFSGKTGDKTDINRGNGDFWLVQIAPDGTKLYAQSIAIKGVKHPVVTDFFGSLDKQKIGRASCRERV